MFDKITIEAIKQSIDLREEVSPHLQNPKRQSNGSIKSVCPFSDHKDTEPSFYVHPSYYICFGCGKKGDVFNWYESFHKQDFVEAAYTLSKKANITIGFEDEEEIKKWQIQINELSKKIDNLMEELWEHDNIIDYLHSRNIDDATIVEFSLGYNSDNNSISIPFFDSSMHPVNIVYRSLNETGSKYYFDNDVKPFNGKSYLFNEIDLNGEGTLYVVEGQFDAITLHQYGKRAVAYHGSNISEQQINKIKRSNPSKIVFCPDTKTPNDIQLGFKVVQYIKKSLDVPVKVVWPDEDINNTSPLRLIEVLNQEMPAEIAFLDFILTGDIEEQRIKVKQYISSIQDVLVRDDVIEEVSKRWGKSKDLVQNFIQIKEPNTRIISIQEAIDILEEESARIGVGQFIVHKDFSPFFEPLGAGHNACIAARTSVGKTNFALNLIGKIQEPAQALFISLEQPVHELMARLISIKSEEYGGIDGKLIRPKDIKNMILNDFSKWKYIRQVTEDLCPNIHFYDKPADMDKIKDVIRITKDRFGDQLIVIIDYLGLVKSKLTQDYEKYSYLALTLQNLAKELEVLVLYSHQLNRGAGSGQNQVTLDQLRGSGVLEEAADLIIGLNYHSDDETEMKDILTAPIKPIDINILKNRHGHCDSFEYVLDTRNLTFKPANDISLSGWDNQSHYIMDNRSMDNWNENYTIN